MRVLVTRPEPRASEWVSKLATDGIEAVVLPLLAIHPVDADAIARAWAQLEQRFDGLMFVSPAAVKAWGDAKPPSCAWPSRVWAATPGPGTARSARALGAIDVLEPSSDAEHFDTDSLWAVIGQRDWRGQRILVVHGGAGRDDLARRWLEAGAVIERLQAYQRGDAVWTAGQGLVFDDAMRQPTDHVWLFSSSESVDRLQRRASGANWAAHAALCTHPAITARAKESGFGRVFECRSELDAVAQALRHSHQARG